MSTDTAEFDPTPGVPAAQRAIAEAEAAEAAASARVDYLREEVAVGRVKVGALHVARRRLAAAQEATGVAQARVRALRRDHAAAQLAAEERREAARVAVVAELVPQRLRLEREFVELLGAFVAGLDALSPRIAEWSERAAAAEPPYRPFVPNRGSPPRPGSIALTQPGSASATAQEAARRALAQATTPRRS